MVFLTLLIIPLIIALVGFVFFNHKITLKEFLTQIGIQIIVAAISVSIIYSSNTHDVEIWNGKVLNKTRDEVSCSHSYDCFCYQNCSGSGNDQSCTTICQTCYEHSYDVDWNVQSTLGEISIDREDSQGTIQPKRWTKVIIGESYSEERTYTNYIKAAPDTLFRHQGLLEKYAKDIPNYPNVYDYYRINRVLTVGGELLDKKVWNQKLDDLNKELGPKKKVNLNVIIVFNKPREFFYALQQSWIGGKKNDSTTVIGVDSNLNILWSETMLWTDNKITAIKIRDEIQESGLLDSNKVLSIIEKNISESYQRKQMKDFEYLKSSITPSTTQWIISMLIGIIVAILVSFYFYKENVYNEEPLRRRFL